MEAPNAAPHGEPPADADDWTDEQWIEWLNATDGDAADVGDRRPATTAGRVVHSTGGQMLGLTMLGIAQAIYGPKNQPAIVREANSEPEKDPTVTLHLDYEHPEQSFAVLRPEAEPRG